MRAPEKSVSDAEKSLELLNPPDSPDEEDGFLIPCGQLGAKTRAVLSHDVLGEYDEESEAEQAIRDAGRKSQFWPNVWRISDHGNECLLENFWNE